MRQDKIIGVLLAEVNRRVAIARLGGCSEQDNWISAAALSFALAQVLEQKADGIGGRGYIPESKWGGKAD